MEVVIFLGFSEVRGLQNMPFGKGNAIIVPAASNDEVAPVSDIKTKSKPRLVL